jgi:hypothetical protein
MTCVSERSGSASTGVRATDHAPGATRNAVAIRTRSRLATDQRIRAAITFALPGLLHRDQLPVHRTALAELEPDPGRLA